MKNVKLCSDLTRTAPEMEEMMSLRTLMMQCNMWHVSFSMQRVPLLICAELMKLMEKTHTLTHVVRLHCMGVVAIC